MDFAADEAEFSGQTASGAGFVLTARPENPTYPSQGVDEEEAQEEEDADACKRTVQETH